ncbi:MAG: DegT/DnrJ/EryC1/StrS family aminotransferase [Myxococcota bacterium]
MHVRYSYLPQQFADIDDLLEDVRSLVQSGDFTLGKELQRFEARFAELIGTRYAVGVGSGTDAIKLSLKAVGVGVGDEVITAANTFIATAGAIHELGARPVFVDCDETMCIDPRQIEGAITPRTKAIVPVHWTGYVADMNSISAIAERHGLPIVEDACQAILGSLGGQRAGTFGVTGCFSLHPLKNLNVWGDGGVIVTNSEADARKLRLLRNHGMKNRDEIELLGFNSRLDTLHAVVGNWLIGQTESITARRIENAHYYDEAFRDISALTIPERPSNMRIVYHLYMVMAERRDALLHHCQAQGIECKIHYPIPLYRQEGLRFLGYSEGDFPVSDRHASESISFPCDQHLSASEREYVAQTVRDFYEDAG